MEKQKERAIFSSNGHNFVGDVVRKNKKTVVMRCEFADGKVKYIKKHRQKHDIMVIVSC